MLVVVNMCFEKLLHNFGGLYSLNELFNIELFGSVRAQMSSREGCHVGYVVMRDRHVGQSQHETSV